MDSESQFSEDKWSKVDLEIRADDENINYFLRSKWMMRKKRKKIFGFKKWPVS